MQASRLSRRRSAPAVPPRPPATSPPPVPQAPPVGAGSPIGHDLGRFADRRLATEAAADPRQRDLVRGRQRPAQAVEAEAEESPPSYEQRVQGGGDDEADECKEFWHVGGIPCGRR